MHLDRPGISTTDENYRKQLADAHEPVILDFYLDHRSELTSLKNYRQIRGLHVSAYNCPEITNEELDEIADIPNLEELWINASASDSDGLAHLKRLKRLTHLSISGRALGESDMMRISELRSLKSLAFFCDVSTFKPISGLSLKRLIIHRSATAADLAQTVKQLQWLQVADFSEVPPIGNQLLRALFSLPRLHKLSLNFLKIEPGALENLNSRSIHELTMIASASKSDIESLRHRLPNLKKLDTGHGPVNVAPTW
jgi:hypothetical protein